MHAPAVPPGQRLAALALAESIDAHKDQIVAGWLGHVGTDALVRYPDLDRYLRSILSGLVEVLREGDWSLSQTIIDGLAERRARVGVRLEYGIQRAMLAGRYAVRPFYPDDYRLESDDLMIETLHECVFRYFESFQGVQLTSETERVHTRIIRSLVMALEARDPYTKGHSVQVALLAQRMAESLTHLMDPERAYLAGLLHDVGKVGIPDSILQKRGSLTPAEWKTMQLHPITGASILKPIKLYPEVISAVLAHHENYDGTGYPHGTAEDSIHPIARVLRVADSFDAMTSTRVHRGGVAVTEAVEDIVSLSGVSYDPEIVESFVKTVEAPGVMRELSLASLQIDLQDFAIDVSV